MLISLFVGLLLGGLVGMIFLAIDVALTEEATFWLGFLYEYAVYISLIAFLVGMVAYGAEVITTSALVGVLAGNVGMFIGAYIADIFSGVIAFFGPAEEEE